MHRSHWDIEVYAKDFQENRWREAARRRLADEAVEGGAANRVAVNPFNLAVARVLTAMSSWLSSGRVAGAPRTVGGDGAELLRETEHEPRPARSSRPAQPYTDMVVIARGPLAGVREQPSAVSDC